MFIIGYIIQIDQYYRTLYLAEIVVYAAWSFIVMLFLYIDKLPQKTDDVAANFLHAYEIKDPAIPKQKQEVTNTKYKLIRNTETESPLAQKLEFIYFKQYPEIFEFLERRFDLNMFDIDITAIVQ